jgi:hypothetical protein
VKKNQNKTTISKRKIKAMDRFLNSSNSKILFFPAIKKFKVSTFDVFADGEILASSKDKKLFE